MFISDTRRIATDIEINDGISQSPNREQMEHSKGPDMVGVIRIRIASNECLTLLTLQIKE